MIKKSCRLTREDIASLIKGSSYKKIGFLSLKYQFINNQASKLGIVVSKKIAKSSVVRHRFKREIIDMLGPVLPSNGIFMLVTVSTLPVECQPLRYSPSKITPKLIRDALTSNNAVELLHDVTKKTV